MNTGVHVSFQLYLCPDIHSGGGLLDHMAPLFFQFFKELHIVLHTGSANLHSHQQYRRAPLFPTPSSAFVISRLFDDGPSDWSEVIPHCSFDVHFSNHQQDREFFHVPIGHLCFLWRNVCKSQCNPYQITNCIFHRTGTKFF